MSFKKKENQEPDDEAPLSPEADALLAAACAEYDAKQEALTRGEWRLASCTEWGFDDDTGTVTVRFEDGSQWQAEGQFLGTFNSADSTFQWAWDSLDMGEHLTRDSKVIKEVGERYGIQYLTMGGGCFPLPGTEFVDYLCSIGLKVTNSFGVMEAGAEGIIGLLMLKNPRWTRSGDEKEKAMTWSDPLDPVAITTESVASGTRPVLLVIHEEGPGGWQFMDGGDVTGAKPHVIPKDELLKLDPTLNEVTDLPVDWEAQRRSASSPWVRRKR